MWSECKTNVWVSRKGCVKISLVSQKRFCSLITKCSISNSTKNKVDILESYISNLIQRILSKVSKFCIQVFWFQKPFSNGSASSLAQALWAIDTDNMVSADTALMDSLKSIYGIIITKEMFVLDAPIAVIFTRLTNGKTFSFRRKEHCWK